MPLTEPNPRTWILRFKHHRTTVLLHIDPLQALSSVKQELLTALQQTHPTNTINDIPIPKNAADILLARPKDINNLGLGFESIEPSSTSIDSESDAVVGAGKGKGKAAATATSSKAGVGRGGKAQLKDCPQGAGLRDHGIVAFKFKKVDGDVVISIEEEEEDEGIAVAKEDMEMQGVEEEWDVVVPSFEETYGEEP